MSVNVALVARESASGALLEHNSEYEIALQRGPRGVVWRSRLGDLVRVRTQSNLVAMGSSWALCGPSGDDLGCGEAGFRPG